MSFSGYFHPGLSLGSRAFCSCCSLVNFVKLLLPPVFASSEPRDFFEGPVPPLALEEFLLPMVRGSSELNADFAAARSTGSRSC